MQVQAQVQAQVQVQAQALHHLLDLFSLVRSIDRLIEVASKLKLRLKLKKMSFSVLTSAEKFTSISEAYVPVACAMYKYHSARCLIFRTVSPRYFPACRPFSKSGSQIFDSFLIIVTWYVPKLYPRLYRYRGLWYSIWLMKKKNFIVILRMYLCTLHISTYRTYRDQHTILKAKWRGGFFYIKKMILRSFPTHLSQLVYSDITGINNSISWKKNQIKSDRV